MTHRDRVIGFKEEEETDVLFSTLPAPHLFLTSFPVEMLRSKSGSWAADCQRYRRGYVAQCPRVTNRETEAHYESIYLGNIESSWPIPRPPSAAQMCCLL